MQYLNILYLLPRSLLSLIFWLFIFVSLALFSGRAEYIEGNIMNVVESLSGILNIDLTVLMANYFEFIKIIKSSFAELKK
jgi:hypothetical protein